MPSETRTKHFFFYRKNRSVFWGNFSLFATPDMLKSSLHDTQNLGLIVVSSLTLISDSFFIAT